MKRHALTYFAAFSFMWFLMRDPVWLLLYIPGSLLMGWLEVKREERQKEIDNESKVREI